ncbi:LLM class flavin-dependent oxidoreductase [Sulfurimonas aquatica]|uniref:LLM class flavin-dependent oxidoreductase n=1 Tax=Sulfurimonas aquatica TaxID=2672570 RepID=A0A975AYT4_9BACT|nr:LLM class flavin-dependent oxidoreductase [Sulfurimonas aquatica]QSZ41089.1 LLM class flavin-dependent oxidoreductase [Sulfurimonas aquatica]
MSIDKLSPEGFSIGVELPLDNDWSSKGILKREESDRPAGVPDMQEHIRLIKLVDELGYRAAWLRDVPLYDPKFGDAAQVYEIFTYLGFLAAHTKNILLGSAAIVLPLREPWLVRKAYNTLQVLSENRFLLGVASGDRPVEYPLFEKDFESRGAAFRKSLEIITGKKDLSMLRANNLQLLPHAPAPKVLVAGLAQQSPAYIGEHCNGWLAYPRTPQEHDKQVKLWREVASDDKPYVSFIHLDFKIDEDDAPIKRHWFGISTGKNGLIEELNAMKAAGVNHIGLQFRKNEDDLEDSIRKIAQEVLILF